MALSIINLNQARAFVKKPMILVYGRTFYLDLCRRCICFTKFLVPVPWSAHFVIFAPKSHWRKAFFANLWCFLTTSWCTLDTFISFLHDRSVPVFTLEACQNFYRYTYMDINVNTGFSSLLILCSFIHLNSITRAWIFSWYYWIVIINIFIDIAYVPW